MTGGRSGKVALLGIPIDMGASQRGTLMGPAALLAVAVYVVAQLPARMSAEVTMWEGEVFLHAYEAPGASEE